MVFLLHYAPSCASIFCLSLWFNAFVVNFYIQWGLTFFVVLVVENNLFFMTLFKMFLHSLWEMRGFMFCMNKFMFSHYFPFKLLVLLMNWHCVICWWHTPFDQCCHCWLYSNWFGVMCCFISQSGYNIGSSSKGMILPWSTIAKCDFFPCYRNFWLISEWFISSMC